jgi:hypothetical protein
MLKPHFRNRRWGFFKFRSHRELIPFEKLIQELKKWGIEGFHNHENLSYEAGYLKDCFPDYLPLKIRLLRNRDSASQDDMRGFFNALRLYVYSLFENIWFGYIISHSEDMSLRFRINGLLREFERPYQTHLPSFSSAIMHYGTCRDLFFILLKLSVQPEMIMNLENFGKLLRIRYKKDHFKKDLTSLSGGVDSNFVELGLKIYDDNELRNYFAHRMRLIWWINKDGSHEDRYLFKRSIFEAIKHRKNKDSNRFLFEILNDPEHFKSEIANSDRSELVSAGEILRDIHNRLAPFINNSFSFIHKLLQKTNYGCSN